MHMTTTLTREERTLETQQLTGLVGLVRITSDDPEGNARLREEVGHWLTVNNWSRHVKIESEEAVAGCEVTFVPGEHQSNPPVKLAFHAVPGAERVLHRLTHWLYELM